MNAEILFILAALAVQTDVDGPIRFETATPYFVAAMRGEDPEMVEIARAQNASGLDQEPPPNGSVMTTPPGQTYGAPMDAAQTPQWNPFSYGQANPTDPFMGQPPVDGAPMPMGGGQFAFGVNGPQPYRIGGWISRYDAGEIFSAKTNSGVQGHFAVSEANAAARYSNQLPGGTIFSWTPEFNWRGWSGPSSIGLPGSVFRIASDFELAFPGNGIWSAQFGFTPALASDFSDTLTNKAWNFDGRGILFYRASPQLSLGIGVVYWNRVKNYILPYAGAIWTPDDRWEFRIMYPKTLINWFVGTPWGAPTWLYGSAEFHVESYQIDVEETANSQRIQVSDYRAAVGVRSEGRVFSSFLEGGWVFDRKVRFRGISEAFGINDGPMVRAGVRF